MRGPGAPHLYIPVPHRPAAGRSDLRRGSFVYFAVALTGRGLAIAVRTRAGLILRAVGENHSPAIRSAIRCCGFGCSAVTVRRRLRGPWRAPICPWSYTPLWPRHDGRARLDRAGAGGVRLVAAVAASPPARVCSARSSILQLNPRRSASDPLPIPHLAALSDDDRRAGADLAQSTTLLKVHAPACLARTFMPDN